MKTVIRQSIGLVVGLSLAASLTACNMLPFGKKTDDGKVFSQNHPASTGVDKKTGKKFLDAGNTLTKQGKWDEAITQFEKSVAADPTNSIAQAQMGWAYAEKKEWDKAKLHLLEAIKIDPRNSAAHANLAWVYAEQKSWEEARKEASKAIDLDGKNPYAHATLAWAYQSTDQMELALSEYEKSVELLPTLENSHFALGMAYCNKGVADKAKSHLAKLNELHAGQAAELNARVSKGCYPPKR